MVDLTRLSVDGTVVGRQWFQPVLLARRARRPEVLHPAAQRSRSPVGVISDDAETSSFSDAGRTAPRNSPRNLLRFIFSSFIIEVATIMSASPAGLHLQDLILDAKATASKEQKAEAVSQRSIAGSGAFWCHGTQRLQLENKSRLHVWLTVIGIVP